MRHTLVTMMLLLSAITFADVTRCITIDSTILPPNTPNVVQLCDRIRDVGGFSPAWWAAEPNACLIAVTEKGFKGWGRVIADELGRAAAAEAQTTAINDYMIPLVAGLDLNGPVLITCGDGVVEGDEECDDSNQVEGDGCQADCRLPVCGDSVVDAGETCDDGNNFNNDGCSATCQTE